MDCEIPRRPISYEELQRLAGIIPLEHYIEGIRIERKGVLNANYRFAAMLSPLPEATCTQRAQAVGNMAIQSDELASTLANVSFTAEVNGTVTASAQVGEVCESLLAGMQQVVVVGTFDFSPSN